MMPLTKYAVEVSTGDKHKTLEVHAHNKEEAASLTRHFAGEHWAIDKITEKGESNAPSNRSGYVGSHD